MKQESNRQTTMEDIDGGLHPAVDGQSLDEVKDAAVMIVVGREGGAGGELNGSSSNRHLWMI